MYKKPKHLSLGDTVAVISPSSGISDFPRRLQRGLQALCELGFNPVLSENALAKDGHRAGTPEQRASDFMKCFEDEAIKAIFCSTGGWNCIDILNLLDYQKIKRNNKIFVGYSDITSLHCALQAKCGMVSFYGPTVLPSLGEFGGAFEFTKKSLINILCGKASIGFISTPHNFTEEELFWDKDDWRPRKVQPAGPPRTICEGIADGILLGGNLDTISLIADTEYFPSTDGAILLLEDEGGCTAKTERALKSLYLKNVFKGVKGIIFARPYRFRTISPERSLDNILYELGYSLKIPIIMDIAAGHTEPRLTLPLGVNITVDATNAQIRLNEKGVI